MKVTLSVIKADVGSIAGHHKVISEQLEVAREVLDRAKKKGVLLDFYVTAAGDDIVLN